MVYAVPASKRSLKQNRFEFTVPGDKKLYSMPLARYLTTGQVEEMSKLGDEVGILDILALFDERGGAVTKGASAAVRTLEQEQVQELMVAWQTESGISVGESSASE